MNIVVLYSELNCYCSHTDFDTLKVVLDHINTKEFQRSKEMLHIQEPIIESLILNTIFSKTIKFHPKVHTEFQKDLQTGLTLL